MRRFLFLLLIFVIGCGGNGEPDAPVEDVTAVETAVSSTTAPPTEAATAAATATTAATPVPPPFDLATGFTAEPLPYDFRGITQFFVQENQLWAAQLNGGEGAEDGQVIRIDIETGERTVLLENLDKPTGVALLNDTIWVATRDELLRAPLADLDALEVVLTGLPNNGRSNGTLTVTPNGRLLYETSGRRSIADSSGRLYELDPATDEVRELASGLKNAYAHVFDANGRLWITEVADGSVDGVTYPGEINLVVEGADFGWPTCYGRELAGPDCDGTRPAVKVLPEHSTPTGIAVSPFSDDTLFVALWVTGEVLEIPVSISGDNARGGERPFIQNMQNPQHLFTHPDGSLWVSEFATGKIWIIRQQ